MRLVLMAISMNMQDMLLEVEAKVLGLIWKKKCRDLKEAVLDN